MPPVSHIKNVIRFCFASFLPQNATIRKLGSGFIKVSVTRFVTRLEYKKKSLDAYLLLNSSF